MRSVWAYLLVSSAFGLSACGFESAQDEAPIDLNSCSADVDCGANATCSEGMCVARRAEDPLSVWLEVAPLRTPDGSEALPFIHGGVMVEGPRSLRVEVPRAAQVGGRIRSDGAPLAADVSFTPSKKIPNVPAKVISTSIGEDVPENAEEDFRVRLLSGLEYRMTVRPRDGALPPVSQTIVAEPGSRHDVDYDDVELEERSFEITGAGGRTLVVKAVDRRSGETISSTGLLEDDQVSLLFVAGSEVPYRLVISAEQIYEEGLGPAALISNAETCDTATPISPVFGVDDEVVQALSAASSPLVLPPRLERIRFQGVVEACDQAQSSAEFLPVNLRSQALSFEPGAQELAASYATTTDAYLDPDSGQYRFCVYVKPGEYEVVVTPPASMECAVFAERRLISAPDGVAATGALFELPTAFRLAGALRTNSLMPLRGATVAAMALGRSGAFTLDDADQSLTQFNRSRETMSDEQGEFSLALDLGSYDILVKPHPDSGFSWQVYHDVNLNRGMLNTVVDMRSPVSLSGQLVYEGDDEAAARSSLEGAEVRAFVVIGDPYDTDRSIPVGKATAGPTGGFTLLLPPKLQQGL